MDKTEMFEMNIKGALKELKRLREDKSGYKAEYDLKMAAFEEANKDLINNMEKINAQSTTMEDIIRTNSLDHYNLNKNKQVCFGVGIREMQNVLFDDDLAKAWAIQTGLCLKLDVPAFKKIAKVQDIDFVTIENKPAATIPTKIEVS